MDNREQSGVNIGNKRFPLFVWSHRPGRSKEDGAGGYKRRRLHERTAVSAPRDAPTGPLRDIYITEQESMGMLRGQPSSMVPEQGPVQENMTHRGISFTDDATIRVLESIHIVLSYKVMVQTGMVTNGVGVGTHQSLDQIDNDVMELVEALHTLRKARANTIRIIQQQGETLNGQNMLLDGNIHQMNGVRDQGLQIPSELEHALDPVEVLDHQALGVNLQVPSGGVGIRTGYPHLMYQDDDALDQYYQLTGTPLIEGCRLCIGTTAPENTGPDTSTMDLHTGGEPMPQTQENGGFSSHGVSRDDVLSSLSNLRFGGQRPIHPFLDHDSPEYGEEVPANMHSTFSLERISFLHHPFSTVGFPHWIKDSVASVLGVTPEQIKAYTRPGRISVTLDVMTSSGGFDYNKLEELGDFWMEFSLSEAIMMQLHRLLLFTTAEKTIHLSGDVDQVSEEIHSYRMSNALTKVTPICILDNETSTICLEGEQVDHRNSIPVCRQDEKLLPLTQLGTRRHNGNQPQRFMSLSANIGCLEVEIETVHLLSPSIPVLVLPNDHWGRAIAAEVNACTIPTCHLHNLLRQSGHVISSAIYGPPGMDVTLGGIFSVRDLIEEAHAYRLDSLARYINFLVLED
ncbi:hypothetical protein M9434_002716 [Picochlorum sp. BPE23]|nr:hypothetical protein M9434_002716 [Picochlorum sp. BPE23]